MSKLIISKDSNPNYLCKVVSLKNLQKHSNADRLQIATIDFQTVITGIEAKDGDVVVYFPIESKINASFISHTNSFRKSELNSDKEKVGFFEETCRVKAMKLRGEKSMGCIVPIQVVIDFVGDIGNVNDYIGMEFDTINNCLLVEKFIVKSRLGGLSNKQGKEPKLSRLIEGQVHLHVDTENLRKNVHKLELSDTISLTYKTHGTSFWVGNVKVKKYLKWYEKALQKLGVNIIDTEYDYVYGSRKVVKNESLLDPKSKDHFYGYDLWKDIKDNISEYIPKGYTLYGECLGYTKAGGFIQKPYDYGCKEGESKLEIYRITHTNEDGLVTELSYPEIKQFCNRVGLTASFEFYYGTINNMEGFDKGENWRESFVKYLEKTYNEKDCFMCKNSVPEEGIVVRKESLFYCESYKLKSFKFLEYETKVLDAGEADTESLN